MLIQEGILISVFFAALLSLIVADRIFKSQCKVATPQTFTNRTPKISKADLETGEKIVQEQQQVMVTKKNTAYDFQLRYQSHKSVPAKVLFVLAWINYTFSFAFNEGYESYLDASVAKWNGNDELTCVIPGAFVLANYSFFLVMGSGSLVMCFFVASGLYKITHLLSLQCCPVVITAVKKKFRKIPRDFSNYGNEFDFECDSEPICWE